MEIPCDAKRMIFARFTGLSGRERLLEMDNKYIFMVWDKNWNGIYCFLSHNTTTSVIFNNNYYAPITAKREENIH